MWKEIKQYQELNPDGVNGSTLLQYISVLRYFSIAHHDPIIENITLSQVKGYINTALEHELSGNNMSTWTSAFKNFFRYLQVWEKRETLPFEYIKNSYTVLDTYRVPTTEDIQIMINSIRNHRWKNIALRNTAIILILMGTGMRRAELCGLRLQDIDHKRFGAYAQVLKNKKIKSGREWRFWSEETHRELEKYIEYRITLNLDHDYLFVALDSQKFGKPLDGEGICSFMIRECKKNNIPQIKPHGLRHWYATYLAECGASAIVIQNLLCHADIGSSRTYVKASGDRLRKMASKYKVSSP